MTNFIPGDINIDLFAIVSDNGYVTDLTIAGLSIYESVFTPGTVCDIAVIDNTDLIGRLRISRGETVILNISVPTTNRFAKYVFAIDSINDTVSTGSQKSKMYVIKCVSEEVLFAQTNMVEKNYLMLCSEMVKDIHENNLKSSKDLIVENTKGAQKILVPKINPYGAIDLIKKISLSENDTSSLYSYFETRKNDKQVFKYVTLESLFNEDVVKTFKQSDTINDDFFNENYDNILSYKVDQHMSSIDTIKYAGARNTMSVNLTTSNYQSSIRYTDDTSYKSAGGKNSDLPTTFINKYLKSNNPGFTFIPMSFSQIPDTKLISNLADRQAYLSMLLQNSLRIRVYGDTALTCGVMIDCNIPNKQSIDGPTTADPLLTGKFLITRIHHRIGMQVDRPRYTCIIECIKGKYS